MLAIVCWKYYESEMYLTLLAEGYPVQYTANWDGHHYDHGSNGGGGDALASLAQNAKFKIEFDLDVRTLDTLLIARVDLADLTV